MSWKITSVESLLFPRWLRSLGVALAAIWCRWEQQADQDFSGDPNELSRLFIMCVNNLVARDFKLLVYQKKYHQQRVPYEPVENLHPSFGLHSTQSILFWTTSKHQHELTIINHQIRIKWRLLIVISRKNPAHNFILQALEGGVDSFFSGATKYNEPSTGA